MRRVSIVSLVLFACTEAPPEPIVIDQADAPTAVAAAVCSAEHDCGCPMAAWPDRETCVAAEIQRMEDAAAIAAEQNLLYDGECVGRRVQAHADAGCDRDFVLEPCALSCKPYVGDAAEGEACQRLGITVSVDTCAQGLACEAGACVPMCDRTPALMEGAACAAGIESLGECEPTLYCTPDTQRCAPRPDVGDACPHDACLAAAYCDRSDPEAPICVARLPAGEPCLVDVECESERCTERECAAPAAAACSFRVD